MRCPLRVPSRPTLASLLFDLGVDEQHLYSCNAGLLWRGSFTHHLLTDKGERFLFRGSVTKPGRTIVVADGQAYAIGVDGDAKLIATMTGTMMTVLGREGIEG